LAVELPVPWQAVSPKTGLIEIEPTIKPNRRLIANGMYKIERFMKYLLNKSKVQPVYN
jgi:hypothetical protein